MSFNQPGILPGVPMQSRYLEFGQRPGADLAGALQLLASMELGDEFVVGLGAGLVQGLGGEIEGLTAFPNLTGPGCEVPSTQSDLWVWLRGDERGDLVLMARGLEAELGDAFSLEHMVDGFRHDTGRDLTGYEDGTENPKGDDAISAAFATGRGEGLDGSSFVAVQQWVHDLGRFGLFDQQDRDNIIGRRLKDNVELEDAPETAHVKRTAQESFDPEAFVLRRSMPWADSSGEGLMFVAFGSSHDAFGAQMRRMVGLDDGIVDGLFRFSRPVTGSYYWCPPVTDGHLDLSRLEL
ncbi:MAG: Dyp-type peroxidase [Alphaproteobacteria bacterium]|jgi:putative iron-dependent peroxidase